MSLFDRVKRLVEAEKNLVDMTMARDAAVVYNGKLEQRVLNLEAALRRLTRMTSDIAVGGEEVMILRTCIAVLEDESWTK